MFADIASDYDRVNTVLSFGVHHAWRTKTIAESGVKAGDKVLDCATGTGDLAIAFKKAVGKEDSVSFYGSARFKHEPGSEIESVGSRPKLYSALARISFFQRTGVRWASINRDFQIVNRSLEIPRQIQIHLVIQISLLQKVQNSPMHSPSTVVAS